jgi:hypothetical protein
MALAADDLMQARETVGRLLEQLGLKTYLFAVEPSGGTWQVRIECAARDGWQTLSLAIDAPRLRDCADRDAVQKEVLQQWRERLATCQRA